LRDWHTLPIDRRIWATYSDALTQSVRTLVTALVKQPGADSPFDEVRAWVDRLLQTRSRTYSLLLALQPFQPFDHACAERLADAVDRSLQDMADAVEEGRLTAPMLGDLDKVCDDWPSDGGGAGGDAPLSAAFGLEAAPANEHGDFKPGRVFEAYKYNNGSLLRQIAPHLTSLGVPVVGDVLACVSIVGCIASSEDPVVAYSSMDAMLTRLFGARSSDVVQKTLLHFEQRERVARQARRRMLSILASVGSLSDHESRALALADVYKRLIEGPVRHYGWALHCLGVGSWSPPPTLTPVREALVAQGGLGRAIAESSILVDLRNGEAHESLEWDGPRQAYLVEGNAVDFDRVTAAVLVALSFDRGCEAAIACFRALTIRPVAGPPRADEESRMPAWQRAESYFGTNGLRLIKADFNATTAMIKVASFGQSDINPCFQALLCARRLLPDLVGFEVYLEGASDPAIAIDTRALDHTLPVWNQALATFDMMPLSAFLPANLAARSFWETAPKAVRAVSWIAADDLLDALDGGPDIWDQAAIDVFGERVALVEVSLAQCLGIAPADTHTRLNAIRTAVHDLQADLPRLCERPLSMATLDNLPCIMRIRHFWSVWGPVPRLPNIYDTPTDGVAVDRQPRLREQAEHLDWLTL
jgi:hypothetical protein